MYEKQCPECHRYWSRCAAANLKSAVIYQCGAGPLPAAQPTLPGAGTRNQAKSATRKSWRQVWIEEGYTLHTPEPDHTQDRV